MAARKSPAEGRKGDKIMRDALLVALKREAEDGKPTRKLAEIAEKLVELAVSGDMPAIKEVFDRVDGKPAQALEHTGKDGEPLFDPASVSELEVYQRMVALVKRTGQAGSVEPGGEQPAVGTATRH